MINIFEDKVGDFTFSTLSLLPLHIGNDVSKNCNSNWKRIPIYISSVTLACPWFIATCIPAYAIASIASGHMLLPSTRHIT